MCITFAGNTTNMPSLAEENYLKAIYHLSADNPKGIATKDIAEAMSFSKASVTDMVTKLAKNNYVNYQRYKGAILTKKGESVALRIIRRHRIWEVFLVKDLKFNWDEVHEVAEQLEHIVSPLLINRLDAFLGHPEFDPHGDPIPNESGVLPSKIQMPLTELSPGLPASITSVATEDSPFLKYLDKLGAYIGAQIEVCERIEFDGSLEVSIDGRPNQFISGAAAKNIMITE
jgi:DtxR family Mn-dependent transcriptional regulator